MLKVENIIVKYREIAAIKGISFNIMEKEFVTLLGANGAGKSTLLKAVSGIIKAAEGRILFEETDITSHSPENIFKRRLVHVPEGRHVIPGLTVMDNLMLGGASRTDRPSRVALKKDIENVLDIFPVLNKVLNRPGWTLSGGEQQMVAIGRGLMGKPKLLMLDEPSLGLAPVVVKELFSCIKKINQQGITILLVEQNARLALEVSSRVYIMQLGKVVYENDSEIAKTDSTLINSYLGTKN